ncbi:MAG: biotin-dependent carboxyltransferase [Pyrinomonadaceae bacterium]|nr:biotin-dependent carboxyltransferase [Pyrinomonadaceae bacterium]
MTLEIVSGGLLSTIQDLGRNGFRRFGINPNGAMDKKALRLINLLLGNDEDEAAIEMHFPAAVIRFCRDAVFALGGADFRAELDGKPVQNWKAMQAASGQKLEFKEKCFGFRVYFAIHGGFKIEKSFGSGSTNLQAKFGGFRGRSLKSGDVLELNNSQKVPVFAKSISFSIIPEYKSKPVVRITAGNEFDLLTGKSEEIFFKEVFTITPDSNRMGFRLAGRTLHLLHKFELVSSAVNFGTIQLLPDGQLIILMADHQTTGGYPRVASVIANDLPLLGQLGAGQNVRFRLISQKEAETINAEFESDLKVFKTGCDLYRDI